MSFPKKCPVCQTADKKKFRVIPLGDTFKANCTCGYERRITGEESEFRKTN